MTLDGLKNTAFRVQKILTNKYNNKIIFYFLVTILGGILEMLSIGLLVPIIYILTDGTNSEFSNYFLDILSQFNLLEKNEQLFILIIFLCSIYFIKNLFLGYVHWIQATITTNIQVNLSNNFFKKYINKSILYHSKKNSATALRDLLSETSQFAKGFVFGIMTLVFEFIISMFVFAVILFTDPKTALIIFLFFLFIALFFGNYFKNMLQRWAKERQLGEQERYKNFQESVGSIREIKILGKLPILVERFSFFNKSIYEIIKKMNLMGVYPKLAIEFLLVLFISLISIYFLLIGYPFDRIILILGILAVCSLRLMPVITKIVNSANMVQYSKPSLDVLYKYFLEKDETENEINNLVNKNEVTFENDIVINRVSFSYNYEQKPVIENLNLEINYGNTIGIIGSTGSGKSTLIDLILGLLKPKQGDIKVDNTSIFENRTSWNKLIGYVPQNIFISDDTILRNIALGVDFEEINKDRVDQLLKICNLDELIKNLPNKENTLVGEKGARLSGGQKQRIGIARALYRDPPLLIFDEATNALDIKNEQDIMKKILSEKKRTLIMVTHRPESLNFCNFVYKVDNGKLFKVEN